MLSVRTLVLSHLSVQLPCDVSVLSLHALSADFHCCFEQTESVWARLGENLWWAINPSKRSAVVGGIWRADSPKDFFFFVYFCWVWVLHLWRVILCPQPISRLDQTQSTHIQAITGGMVFFFTSKCRRSVSIKVFMYSWCCHFGFHFVNNTRSFVFMNCCNLMLNLFGLQIFEGISQARCLWLYYHIWILYWEYSSVWHQGDVLACGFFFWVHFKVPLPEPVYLMGLW